MWGQKDSDKEDSPIARVFDAYRIGGVPLALLVVGAVAVLAAVEGHLGGVADADKKWLFGIGGGSIILGAVTWVIAELQRARIQLALFTVMSDGIHEAASTAKDGAHFKVAVEEFTKQFPEMLRAISAPRTRDTAAIKQE